MQASPLGIHAHPPLGMQAGHHTAAMQYCDSSDHQFASTSTNTSNQCCNAALPETAGMITSAKHDHIKQKLQRSIPSGSKHDHIKQVLHAMQDYLRKVILKEFSDADSAGDVHPPQRGRLKVVGQRQLDLARFAHLHAYHLLSHTCTHANIHLSFGQFVVGYILGIILGFSLN